MKKVITCVFYSFVSLCALSIVWTQVAQIIDHSSRYVIQGKIGDMNVALSVGEVGVKLLVNREDQTSTTHNTTVIDKNDSSTVYKTSITDTNTLKVGREKDTEQKDVGQENEEQETSKSREESNHVEHLSLFSNHAIILKVSWTQTWF